MKLFNCSCCFIWEIHSRKYFTSQLKDNVVQVDSLLSVVLYHWRDSKEFRMSCTSEWGKSSEQGLSIYGNIFKNKKNPGSYSSSWSWLNDCQECAKLLSKQRMKDLKQTIWFLFCDFYCLAPFMLLHSFFHSNTIKWVKK